jgi:hypothetical protein
VSSEAISIESIMSPHILKKLIGDSVESFEIVWPNNLIIQGKKGYYIVRQDLSDPESFAVEKYSSKITYDGREAPKILLANKKLYMSMQIIEPNKEVLSAFFGKKVKTVEVLSPKIPELMWMKNLIQDTVNIHFYDDTIYVSNLYRLAALINEWFALSGMFINVSFGVNYVTATILNATGEVIAGGFINKKEHGASFLAAKAALDRINKKDK